MIHNRCTIIAVIIAVIVIHVPVHAMVFDNRYMPLFQRQWVAPEDGRSHAASHVFAVTTTRAFDGEGQERSWPLMYGEYNLASLGKAAAMLGCPPIIKTEWAGQSIPWALNGKYEGQGIDLIYQQALSDHVALGFSLFAMRLDTRFSYALQDCAELRGSGLLLSSEELDDLRRALQQQLGICSDYCHERGISDLDIYFRFGEFWEYTCLCRSIQAGVRLGCIAPTAQQRNIHYPSSIPFGGNGHWGIYGAIDAMAELREDLKVGLYVRANKRFSRVESCQRVPIAGEPLVFGAYQGPVRVDPGVTFVFSPLVSFECLRGGFGARIAYTLTKHWRDRWCPLYNAPLVAEDGVAASVDRPYQCHQGWGSDYFSVHLFYDYEKVRSNMSVYPVINFCWDIPYPVLITYDIPRTHRISLGAEVSF